MTRFEHPCDQLSALLDGELPPAERDRVAAHLRACPECAEQRTLLERAVSALTLVPGIEPSPDLRRRVLAAAEARPPGLADRFRAFLSPRFLVPAGAAAVAALVLLVFAPGVEAPRPGEAEEWAIAERLELLEDFDLARALPAGVGAEDLVVVARLHELEGEE